VKYNFLSIADAAAQLKISVETMKASILQGKYFAWIYVRRTYVVCKKSEWLPAWDESYVFTEWEDIGIKIDDDAERKIQKGKPDTTCRYYVTGWVIFNAPDIVLIEAKTAIGGKWLTIASSADDGSNWRSVYTARPYELYGFEDSERWISEADIFICDYELNLSNSGFESEGADTKEAVGEAGSAPKPLRADARQTYERIIAALWIKAHGDGNAGRLSSDQYTAAKSLSNLLAENGLETPSEDKIGRVLADAKGHGLVIGS
jgi:hypothetical protein